MVWYRCRLVTVDNNNRWVVSARVCVTQLDSTTIDHGRLVLSHGVLQYSRQKVGGIFIGGGGVSLFNGLVQMRDTSPMQSGDIMDFGKVYKARAAFCLVEEILFGYIVQCIHSVQRHC